MKEKGRVGGAGKGESRKEVERASQGETRFGGLPQQHYKVVLWFDSLPHQHSHY